MTLLFPCPSRSFVSYPQFLLLFILNTAQPIYANHARITSAGAMHLTITQSLNTSAKTSTIIITNQPHRTTSLKPSPTNK
ncbi:MAG: hypothetical protein J3R72DRAFT_437419 [Linnemannia gamsii]|nr:MAG: hypothetical protein J3R72DRAFT_437419 [Linnemannia gamsii]